MRQCEKEIDEERNTDKKVAKEKEVERARKIES